MTKKRALELAIVALKIEICNGNIQDERFDDALECLERYYNIDKLWSDMVESPEEWAKREGVVIT